MKIIGKKENQYLNEDGECFLVLKVHSFGQYEQCKTLDKEALYSIEIKTAKSKRSLEQNRKMWALIHEIDKVVNGELSNDPWKVYIDVLREAGVKSEYIHAMNDAEEDLKRVFRAVEYIEPYNDRMSIFRCFYGSSKFDTKEMANMIEVLINMAYEAGLDTEYWKAMLV